MQNDIEILKETKYLSFIVKEHKPKTKVVAVVNKTHQQEIGVIRWYSAWRQYCFYPHPNTIWNTACLNDVNDMITELTPVRPKPQPKTIGVIAQTVRDFQHWRIMKKHIPSKKCGVKNTQTNYVYRNNRYICLTTPNHVCGYSFDKIMIDSKFVYLLKEKQCVCIWCNADVFVEKYGLKGFYTGMIVSEYEESIMHCINLHEDIMKKIYNSNVLFAYAVKKSIDEENMLDSMKLLYDDDNPIIEFNKENLFML